jgi:hypothetical protein
MYLGDKGITMDEKEASKENKNEEMLKKTKKRTGKWLRDRSSRKFGYRKEDESK